jgi:transglutaminase superfamily protein
MGASYFLSPHVHVCVAGKQVVLLDLERDKYLSMASGSPIGRWVRGWPAPPSDSAAPEEDSTSPPESDAEHRLLAKMIAQGLLVQDAAIGKEASPVVADPPEYAIVEYDLNSRPSTTLEHLWRVCTAYTSAKWALRRRPIKEVVETACLRKTHASSTGRWDADTVRPLVTAFTYLRPLFFTSKDACLLDSLTLVNFLAGYSVFPEWVFGVKTDPFHAHCWVQQGGFVFNDTPDYVRGFSPILVV